MGEEYKSWNPDQPISFLPAPIHHLFMKEAAYLLSDLEANKVKIGLLDAPEPHFTGHKIHVVLETNPPWYSSLYATFKFFRRDRSLRALRHIAEGEDRKYRVMPFRYHSRFREYIQERLTEGYPHEGHFIPAHDAVTYYFKTGSLAFFQQAGHDATLEILVADQSSKQDPIHEGEKRREKHTQPIYDDVDFFSDESETDTALPF